MSEKLKDFIELQRCGVRSCNDGMSRRGGAGPTDDKAFIFSNGITLMVPTLNESARNSEYVLENIGNQTILKRNGKVIDTVRKVTPPKFYSLQTKDGIPYRQIARLHGSDCLASTVVQECVRYNDAAQRCRFCGVGVSLKNGSTIHTKTPAQLAEVGAAAKKLDGVTHVTLTTGTTDLVNKGAEYLGRCAYAVKQATGLPIQAQCEPPEDSGLFTEMKKLGVDDIGIHVESFDQKVRSRFTPGKSTISIEAYFESFEKAVAVFGRNRVSTFIILGLGEDEELTLARCRQAVKIGVYPFLVPLRAISSTFMASAEPPDAEYLYRMYVAVGNMLEQSRMNADQSGAGCVKCKACSLLQLTESGENSSGASKVGGC